MTSAVAYDLAYGQEAARRLQSIQETVARLAEQFSSNFFDSLVDTAEGARILGALLEEDLVHLKAREAQHLRLLFAPHLTLSQHQETAQRVGRAHALAGVGLQTLIESFALFQQEIRQEILPLIAPEYRQDILEIVERRNFMDLQSQAWAYQRVDTELSQAASAIDELIQQTANFSDLVRGVMGIIGGIEGDLSAFFARCDTTGELQIEVSQGAAGHRYHEAMMTGLVPKISIDPSRLSGQGHEQKREELTHRPPPCGSRAGCAAMIWPDWQ